MKPRRARLPRAGRREEGFILFLAIFVLLIVTVAGLATVLTTSMDLTLSGNETKVSKVFYAADSGVGYSAARLRSDVNFIGGQMPVGVSSNYATRDPETSRSRSRGYLDGPAGSHRRRPPGRGRPYGTPQVVEP